MWIGEQIDEYGVGNGISLIIMAGIAPGSPTRSSASSTNGATSGMSVLRLRWRRSIAGKTPDWRRVIVLFDHVRRRGRSASSPSRRGSGGSRPSRPSMSAAGALHGGTRQFLAAPHRIRQALYALGSSSRVEPPPDPDVRSPLAVAERGRASQWLLNAAALRWKGKRWLYNMCYDRDDLLLLLHRLRSPSTSCATWPRTSCDYGSFIPGYRPGREHGRVPQRVITVGPPRSPHAAFRRVIAIIPRVRFLYAWK